MPTATPNTASETFRQVSNASLAQLPEYHQRVRVLQALGYLEPSDQTVTMKGRVACEINSGAGGGGAGAVVWRWCGGGGAEAMAAEWQLQWWWCAAASLHCMAPQCFPNTMQTNAMKA